MSTQFTAMNTITLADLTDDNASSGNSVLAVTQQLSISLGVAVSAAVLRVYEGMGRHNDSRTIPLYVYHDGHYYCCFSSNVHATENNRW